MNTERVQVGWGFRLRWMLASTVVLAVGVTVGGVGILIGAANGEVETVLGVAVIGAVVGASLGIVQWLLMRRQVSRSAQWILASAAGGAVGFALAVAVLIILNLGGTGIFGILVDTDGLGATVLVIVIATVASYGIAQWVVLRMKVSRSGWWIIASAVGPAVIYLAFFVVTMFTLNRIEGFSEVSRRNPIMKDGIVIEDTITTYDDPQKVIGWAVRVGVVGAVLGYGAITGGVLVWLLRQPVAKELSPSQTAE